VPHRLLIEATYELPHFTRQRALHAVAGGWKVGVVQTAQSGPTFTVITSANTTNAFPAGPLRPDVLRNAALPRSERTPGRWFDTAAFVNPAPFTFGSSGRSNLRAAPLVGTDVTFEKSFAASERVRIDLRCEFYNVLNHAVFNVPDFTLGNAGFGSVSSARAPRVGQLAARFSF
jgi:hypothetical protein